MGLTQVSTDGVKNDAITKVKIPANQIEASELADNAVDTNAIANNAVTAGKLASGVQTTINTNGDNRVLTGSGTANTLNGESNLVFDGTNLGLGAVASGAASIGQDKLDIRGGGIYLNSQSTATSGSINKISFLKLHPLAPSVSYEQGRVEAYTENGYGAGGLDFYYGKLVGGGNYAATHGIRLNHLGNVGIGTASPTAASSETTLNIYANEYPEVHLTSSVTGTAAGDGSIFTLNNDSSTVIRNQENSYIRFDTNGSNERMRILAGGGLTFNGDTAAANALDDYEEGTFTPEYNVGSAGSAMLSAATYASTGGLYTKIGDMVHFQIRIKCSSHSAQGGRAQINGLPFTHVSTVIASGAYVVASQALGSSNNVRLIIDGTNIIFQNLDGTEFGSGSGGTNWNNEFHCAGTYKAA